MWDALIGTVGLALVLMWGAYKAIRRGMRAVEGGDAGTTAVSTTRRPSGRVATDTRGDHDSALLALQHEERRREFRARCAAATKARGPARLEGRSVSSTGDAA